MRSKPRGRSNCCSAVRTDELRLISVDALLVHIELVDGLEGSQADVAGVRTLGVMTQDVLFQHVFGDEAFAAFRTGERLDADVHGEHVVFEVVGTLEHAAAFGTHNGTALASLTVYLTHVIVQGTLTPRKDIPTRSSSTPTYT